MYPTTLHLTSVLRNRVARCCGLLVVPDCRGLGYSKRESGVELCLGFLL